MLLHKAGQASRAVMRPRVLLTVLVLLTSAALPLGASLAGSGISSAGTTTSAVGASRSPSALRILPFGDSITSGAESSTGGGYRCDLLSDLASLGTDTRFVGSQASGSCAQPDNEGRPGWTIEQLQAIESCTVTGYQPNVVLLDAGTNDINVNTPATVVDGGDPTHAAHALESLVTSIRQDDPGSVVVVGGLITTGVAQTAANMFSFNQEVSAWITQQKAAGWHVGWAGMDAVRVSDLADGLHPNDTGYQLMATAWKGAINQAMADGWVQDPKAPTGPGCNPPTTSSPSASVSQAQSSGTPGTSGTPGAQSYVAPLWRFQGEVAGGVQSGGYWTGAPGQTIRFAALGYSTRADYVLVQPDSTVIGWRDDGPAAGGGNTWTYLGVVVLGIMGNGYAGSQDGQIQFADLAGSGRDDYVWVHTNGTLSVWVNSGIAANGLPSWGSVPVKGNMPAAYNGTGSIKFADLDGDGRADYLWVHPDGSITWWKNGGDGPGGFTWTSEGTIPSPGILGSEIHFGHVFGTRQEDMVAEKPDSSSTGYVLNAATRKWIPEGQVVAGIQIMGYTGPSDGDIDFADVSGQSNRDDLVWIRPDSSVLMWLNTPR